MLQTLKQTVTSWLDHDPFTNSAAVAFYTLFSFPGIVILLAAAASFVFEDFHLEREITQHLTNVIGPDAAQTIRSTIKDDLEPDSYNLTFWLAAGVVLLTSVRLFMQLQKALNKVWEVTPPKDFKHMLTRRIPAFLVLCAMGGVLLLSLFTTAALTTAQEWLTVSLPDWFGPVFHAVNLTISWLMLSFMFCMILKILPDKKIPWRRALEGGMVTAILFMIGEYLLSIYFALADPYSAYGVTGSLILFLVWVSYSCLLLLFGAEFSRTRTLQHSKEQK